MKGILADNDVRGQVANLGAMLVVQPWAEFWRDLGLLVLYFEDIGLSPTASDLDVWERCQVDQLALITGNRNLSGSDSLEATIRQRGTPQCLPVFTIADVDRFNTSKPYAEQVVETLLDYLQRIESLRGTGRLYLP